MNYEVEIMSMDEKTWKPIKKVKECKCVAPLVEGVKYKFRVRAINAQGASDYIETDKETLARDVCDPPDPPSGLKVSYCPTIPLTVWSLDF